MKKVKENGRQQRKELTMGEKKEVLGIWIALFEILRISEVEKEKTMRVKTCKPFFLFFFQLSLRIKEFDFFGRTLRPRFPTKLQNCH